MLFAPCCLPIFAIGGLAGPPLAFNAADLYSHDTYYVVGHFHYAIALGVICAIFAIVYYGFPKVSGRRLNPALGYAHFGLSLLFLSGVLVPMFVQGSTAVHRRWIDGDAAGPQMIGSVLLWNTFMSVSAGLLSATQLILLFNFFWSWFKGPRVPGNGG